MMVLFTTIEYVCFLTNIGCYTINTTISVIQTSARVIHTGYNVTKYLYKKNLFQTKTNRIFKQYLINSNYESMKRKICLKGIKYIDHDGVHHISKQINSIDDLIELGDVYEPGIRYNIDLEKVYYIQNSFDKITKHDRTA